MALDFPASPNINDTYTFGGVTWTYDGTRWKVLGRFQFTSSETDPIFTGSPSFGILQQNINNWNAAYGWGDHSTAGYLTSYTETDPVFTASAAGGITSTQVSNWDTAYGWGDHGSAGYLTSYTETQTLDAVLALGSTTARDITTTGKIYYSNNFATTGDLPNATTYHGMFAHVHAEGHGYFAHAGSWTQLLDTGSSLGELADVDLSTPPNNNDVLSWDGSNWTPSASAGGANVTISDTAPGSATAGDLWWESDKGRLKIYYNDTDSTQWVDASPPLSPTNVSETTTNGSNRVGVTTNTTSSFTDGAIEFVTDNGTTSEARWIITPQGGLIPTTNAAYDIGSAEYKVRDLYLDSGSIHTPSEKNLSFYDGNLTWGGDDVIMLQDLKDMMATATSFEDFKNAIMGL